MQKRHFLFAFLLLFAVGCRIYQQPVSSKIAENNTDYRVDFLFEHDGCRVYRFIDRGEAVYFTSCNGETTRVVPDSTGSRRIRSVNGRGQ